MKKTHNDGLRKQRNCGGGITNVSIVRFGDEAVRQLQQVLRHMHGAADDGGDSRGRGKSPKRGVSRGRTDADRGVRRNRARVVAAILALRSQSGLSVLKSVRRLRLSALWSPRMRGVSDRSWSSYCYRK